MKAIEPYLIFNGNCEDVFSFYSSVFGVEVSFVTRYKDMPDNTDVPESDMKRILHITLPVSKNVILMGADSMSNMENTVGNNIFLSLDMESKEEAVRIYQRLSENGVIIMPLEETFWTELYAMFTDKFGINWMINYRAGK